MRTQASKTSSPGIVVLLSVDSYGFLQLLTITAECVPITAHTISYSPLPPQARAQSGAGARYQETVRVSSCLQQNCSTQSRRHGPRPGQDHPEDCTLGTLPSIDTGPLARLVLLPPVARPRAHSIMFHAAPKRGTQINANCLPGIQGCPC